MSYNWLVADNTICKIVLEVTEDLIYPPLTSDKWKEVAGKFETRWNFPHTFGAIDRKHVLIKSPKSSGSLYYNYIGFYSVVMLALVDGDYNFIWVNAGSNGTGSDAQIWNICELKEMIEENKLGIPEAGSQQDVPYFIVGDDNFALRTFLVSHTPKETCPKLSEQ